MAVCCKKDDITIMKTSAGIMMFRLNPDLEVFLVHPGGPFFKNKDAGAWSIPKGEFEPSESPRDAAIREFKEETGIDEVSKLLLYFPQVLLYLGEITQKSGKKVVAWAFNHNFTGEIKSNLVTKFGAPFPEIDKGQYFSVEEARLKINLAQFELIERLEEHLKHVI
jgi:predicted NUDIX family NTP pyrophosphohydrolase